MDKTAKAIFHYIYKYTFYQWKEPGIQSYFIMKIYIIGCICVGQKPIQLVTYGNKIGLP